MRRRHLLLASVAGALGGFALGGCARPVGEVGPRALSVGETLWMIDNVGFLRAFDPGTRVVSARLDLRGEAAIELQVGGGLLWAYQYHSGVAVVDPKNAKLVRRVPVPPTGRLPQNLVYFAHDAFWVAQPGQLWRVGVTATAATPTALPADFTPLVVAATDRWLWLGGDKRLVRIDPATGAVSTTVTLDVPVEVYDLLGVARGLFAVGVNQAAVWILDPDRGVLTSTVTIPGDVTPYLSFVADGALWCGSNGGEVVRIGPAGVRQVPVADQAVPVDSVVTAFGTVWASVEDEGAVARIDPGTAKVTAHIRLRLGDPEDPTFWLVAGKHSVWVLDGDYSDRVLWLDPVANRAVPVGATGTDSTGTFPDSAVAVPG
jgi:hypothetical protein